MHILIISDIHGNRHGLEAVLQAASGKFDEVLCLGDVVGYGAFPNECCEILQETDAHSLLGNHDAAALGTLSTEWFNDVASFAIEWTTSQLKNTNLQWLQKNLPEGEWEEFRFQAVHGSLREPLEEYIITRSEAQPTFQRMSQPLCFFGHTHVATVYEERDVDGQEYSLEETPVRQRGLIEIEDATKYLINPGSCGQPRDSNSDARYAVFDTDARTVEVLSTPYDIEAARTAIINAGLPKILGDRLRYGR
jgi:predicted phosphodiesterase